MAASVFHCPPAFTLGKPRCSIFPILDTNRTKSQSYKLSYPENFFSAPHPPPPLVCAMPPRAPPRPHPIVPATMAGLFFQFAIPDRIGTIRYVASSRRHRRHQHEEAE